MNRNVLYLVMMSCFLFAGQANAQRMTEFLKKHSRTHEKASLRNSRQESNLFAFPGLSGTISNRLAAQQSARPTTIYREDSYGQKSKYECEYDVYGHVVSVRLYEWNNDSETYEFRGASVREYHQLPNGEFVKTKEESEFIWNEKQRYTAAYDNKGMQLWYQGESFDFDSSTWSVDYRTEARIENGIRTAILHNGKVDDNYTFDSKGRLIRHRDIGYGHTDEATCTWNSNDRLVEVVERGEYDSNGDGIVDNTYAFTYSNIQIVHNEKYFDPYSLSPLDSGSSDENVSGMLWWGEFSIDDYTLHTVYFNVDAIGVENGEAMQGQIRTTVNAAQNQITQVTSVDSEISFTETTYLLDEYGSYRISSEGDDWTEERSVTYNKYGELVRNYSMDTYTDDEGVEQTYRYEAVYNREYDAQHRPIRTTVSNPESGVAYIETYDTWTPVGLPSDVQEAVLSVYYNAEADCIVIDNIGQTDITISNPAGCIVYRKAGATNQETISVASLASGLYIVTAQTDNNTISRKFIKK